MNMRRPALCRGCRPQCLSTALMLLAFLSLVCGLILDTVTRGRWEAKRMAYLAIPGPQELKLP